MLECLIARDSVAYGVCIVLTECRTEAKVGISSQRFIKEYKQTEYIPAKEFIISLGSNNPNRELENNPEQIRTNYQNSKTVRILPNDKILTNKIKSLAEFFGNDVVELEVSNDGVGPKSYSKLAKSIRLKHLT